MDINGYTPTGVQTQARHLADAEIPLITEALRRGYPDCDAEFRLGTILLLDEAAPFLDCTGCRDLLSYLDKLNYARH